MFTSLFQWLIAPVLEESHADRPLRVRRVSLLLLASGWCVFLVSCLCGCVLVRYGTPISGWSELVTGGSIGHRVWQWARTATEAAGAVAFFAGLLSVAFFDRRDNPSTVRVRGR